MLRTTCTRSLCARQLGGARAQAGRVRSWARLSSTNSGGSGSNPLTARPASSARPTVAAVATLTALSGLSYFAGTRAAGQEVAAKLPAAAAAITGPLPAPKLVEPPTDELRVAPGPDEAEVTRMLSAEAYSHAGAKGSGVRRYDGTRVASNAPCEDRFVHGSFPAPGSTAAATPWTAFGVFDGHAGWQTAEHLTHQLVPFVRHALDRVGAGADEPVVQAAIRRAFVALDDSMVKGGPELARDETVSYADKTRRLALAYAGSCALLALFDPGRRVLHVACTGDSRAVLGRQRPDKSGWETTALSEDQTGFNESEAARLAAAHPGEPDVVKGGRVLGIAVSRALGDGRWKWDLATQHALRRTYNGSVLPERFPLRTPPYLTAEPVVTSTRLEARQPAFCVLASDGFWDRVSSAQAVALVGQWLAWQADKSKRPVPAPGPDAFEPPFDRERYRSGHEGALSTRYWEGRAAFRDDNAAVHLVRNALGGEFHGMVSGLLATGSPFSREIRDDITVQVVFFE